MNITRTSLPLCLALVAACAPDPKAPAQPATPPVEVAGGDGVVFSGWHLDSGELVGELRLEGDWAFTELEIATVPLDAGGAELARATFAVPTPATGHTQTVRVPMPDGATRVQIEVARTSLLTCDNAVDRALGIALKEFGADPDPEELAELRGTVVTNCTEQAWSKAFLTCLMKVETERDIADCESAYAPTAESLQAKEERPDCLEVSRRRTALARTAVDTGAMDAESKEFFERMLASNEREIVRSCVADQWTDQTMLCMRDAATATAFEQCRPAATGAGAHNPMAGKSACQSTAEHLGALIRAEMKAQMPARPQPPVPPKAPAAGTEDSPEAVAAREAYEQQRAAHEVATADYQAQLEAQEYFVQDSVTRFAAMCTQEKWNSKARSCIQRARSVGQLGPCDALLAGDDE
jgi:hypothetical protein